MFLSRTVNTQQISRMKLSLFKNTGRIRINKNSDLVYLRVYLQGVVSLPEVSEKPRVFHRSNILDTKVQPHKETTLDFKFRVPETSRFDMSPQKQRELQQAIFDYEDYRKGRYQKTECKVEESIEDEFYEQFVNTRMECQHTDMLPSYNCSLTGSKVEYEIVVQGWTGKKSYFVWERFAIIGDVPYPSANINMGIDPYHYFGLTDTFEDRVCVIDQNYCIPVPKPLRIGKNCSVTIMGAGSSAVKVVLNGYEVKKTKCEDKRCVEKLVYSEVLMASVKLYKNKLGVPVPTKLVPSFETCQLMLMYKLEITINSRVILVPVGVNFSGEEC